MGVFHARASLELAEGRAASALARSLEAESARVVAANPEEAQPEQFVLCDERGARAEPPTTHRHRALSIIAVSYPSKLRSWEVCAPKPGDVEKRARMKKVASTAIAIYLPPYSLDLNPIELGWADLKRQLRHLAIDTEEELRAAVRKLRSSMPIEKLLAGSPTAHPAFNTSDLRVRRIVKAGQKPAKS